MSLKAGVPQHGHGGRQLGRDWRATFDEHACSILYNIHSLHVDDIESLRSPSVMQGIEPELRIALLSDLDSRENIIAALRREALSSDIAVTEDRL
jgi:hypothetical protein